MKRREEKMKKMKKMKKKTKKNRKTNKPFKLQENALFLALAKNENRPKHPKTSKTQTKTYPPKSSKQKTNDYVIYGINIENNIGIKKRVLKDKVANTNAIKVSIDKKEWNSDMDKNKSDLNIDIAELNRQKSS